MVSESSDYAKDGTEAHDLFAFALKGGYRDAAIARMQMPSSWTHRQDTFDDRLQSVQMALDWTWDQMDAWPDAEMHVETRVDFPSQITNDCWGHADVIIYVASMDMIIVPDYKHGAGKFVPAKNNTQIGIYGAAAWSHMKRLIGREPSMIIMAIIQPRAYARNSEYIRKWIMSAAEMREVFIPNIEGHIAKCESPDAAFNPTPEACQFCPAALRCPAREAAAASVAGQNFTQVRTITPATIPQTVGMPIERLVEIHNKAPLLYGFLEEVEKAIVAHIRAGNTVPGWKLVEAEARRKWYGSELEVATELMKLTGSQNWDDVYPRKLIGITAAETLVKKAFREKAPKGKKNEASSHAVEAMAYLTLKQSSGNLVLAEVSDPRPSVNVAQTTFANVQFIEPPKGN